MNIASTFIHFLKATAAFLVTAIGFLFSAEDGDDDKRALSEGADLFGEQNFRTGRLDSGSDPDGWYEEDL